MKIKSNQKVKARLQSILLELEYYKNRKFIHRKEYNMTAEEKRNFIEDLLSGINTIDETQRNNIIKFYTMTDEERVFSSPDVAEMLGCTMIRARTLIEKMKDRAMIIEAVIGHGKSKYRILTPEAFKNQQKYRFNLSFSLSVF